MKIADYITLTIDRLPRGYVFTYADFIIEVNKKEAIIKALNRMAASGKIVKLSKGKYYKPENTPFGTLEPNQAQLVKDLLEEKGKTTGYLTGYSIYNQLGLTTQVSNIIQIGKNQVRPKLKRGRYTISFVKQKNTISKENIPFLQLLDAIRYIKRVPDASVESSCRRFLAIIKNYTEKEVSTLVRLAQKYPPATRALLGSILEELHQGTAAEPLYKSLNPITTYKLTGAAQALSTTENWNIV
ncbi:DUF6088 family protein [Parapedobacter sp. 10938]|uniref:DUF6088 family protein n=1 Tax=Parapedobacter flavus TaxID=3110225 RepID=UPI002DBF3E12|nr:DUF6088 family protein [Parapedobacter sp. 10938]MEC3881907.1 DUF6088 family protein [Parapedobacter sp. 10938]